MKSTNDKIDIDKRITDIFITIDNYGTNSEARLDIRQLIKETLQECIGEEYVFERPKDEYLPNVYQFLKGKNELRQQAHKKLEELLNG